MTHSLHEILLRDSGNTHLELTISKAGIEDAADILVFLNQVGGESNFLTFGLNQFPLKIEDEEKIIKDFLETNSGLMLTGKIENTIIAQLFLEIPSQKRLSHVGHLGISVSKKYWGMNIAKHLINSAILWAKANHLTKIQLQVRCDNHRATQLYKKIGFKTEGVVTQSLKIEENYFDEYLMGLNLNAL